MHTKLSWWERVKEKTRPGIEKKIREMTHVLLPKHPPRKNKLSKCPGYDPLHPPPYERKRS